MSRRVVRGAKELIKARAGPWLVRRRPARTDLDPARWGCSFDADGRLRSAGLDLHELAAVHGTPLHVVRLDRVDANARAALLGRNGVAADIFVSYKTQPVPAVLDRLHQHGIGAEVISPYELWLALRLGVPPERIIYNGPAKSVPSIRLAIERGVHLVNANSASEAERIMQVAAEVDRPVRLGVRVQLSATWGGQFGIVDTSARLTEVISRARAAPRVELCGLHVHRGLTMRSAESFHTYVQAVLSCCDRVAETTGWRPEVLDLGGSLAAPTVSPIPDLEHRLNRAVGADLLPPDPADCLSLADASADAVTLVASHFDARGEAPPAVVLEPGRALTSDTCFLLTSVVDVKDDTALRHAVLDAGVGVAEPVRTEYHQLFSVTGGAATPVEPYRLVGPICTPADVLYHHWRLPELAPGHVLAIMDSGAYFVPFSTAFSFPRPAIVLQHGSAVVTARRREEFADLVAYDVVPSPEGSTAGGAPT